ncbi:hypothetical protein F4820DRAFT_436965 [Hypoxylon rubiginosum]|uniref:Uncharacterized protein n=1 Tax=Hypoxylon rubiginosum TaxID=110542 RepID=A0ACB9YLZ3_9PEZI|nr:hypothetical protein F4820DRAFT_436965 [Hypoxylon rubiginosum]
MGTTRIRAAAGKSHKKNKKKSSTKPKVKAQPYAYPSPMPHEYGHNYGPLSRRGFKKMGKGGRYFSAVMACLVVLSYLAGIILGVFVICGCVSSNAGLEHLNLADMHANTTSYNISLRVGYLGGCVSFADTTGAQSDNSSSNQQTYCIPNMRDDDPEDLSEQFSKNLDLVPDAQDFVQKSLNVTVAQAKHLQQDVFFWEPPVLYIPFFVISGIILFVALMSSSHKRRYKTVLVIATILGAFSLALALVVAIGSLQGLNAVLGGAKSQEEQTLGDGIYISRASLLDQVQAGLAASTALFYVCMGILYARR